MRLYIVTEDDEGKSKVERESFWGLELDLGNIETTSAASNKVS